jgi:diguanylate cyclase (GGDEF)-like protein/PAS domain S-box-containing protein
MLDRYGIAHLTLRLHRDDSGDARRVSVEDCNETFVRQAGLDADVGDAFLREAFGVGAKAALAEFVEAFDGALPVFPQFYRSTSRWFSCYARPLDADRLSVVLVDVTDFRSDSALMQLREQAYRYFIEHLPMIAFLRIVSPQPMSLFTAGSFREITGYGPEQGTTTENWLEIVHPDDRETVEAAASELFGEPDVGSELEYRIVRRDGQIRWVHSYDRQFTSEDGSMQIVQGLILDVTERKRQEEALRDANDRIGEQNQLLARLARTDVLTGLLNRRAMQEQLERELRLLSRGRGAFSVLLIDLDNFKAVNDVHGHRAGDRVLMHLSATLSEQLRASDVQARWGGEEFMVLFSGTSGDSAFRVAQKLLARFREHPTIVDGEPLVCTFTGGLVEAELGDTVDSLFQRADKALYQGKNAGRNRIERLPRA